MRARQAMDAYIIDAKRTAIGRAHAEKGIFRGVRADELLAALISDFVPRLIQAEALSDVYVGCVGQHLEQGKNIARLATLLANLPDTVPGATINRLCGSSLQAFAFAAMALHCGQAGTILAGGVEHMHHVPMQQCIAYHPKLFERREFNFTNMVMTAEKVARDFDVSRAEQDEFALESHRKAVAAMRAGRFGLEILPVEAGGATIGEDQAPRPDTSIEALARLNPVIEGGSVTAGNSSPLSDGASLTLLASESACRECGLKPRAKVVDFAVAGVDPCIMGMGPVPAIGALLKRQRLSIADISIFEINEAFASQAIACARELNIPPDRMNMSGGAIAIGHPLGATGTRLVATLLTNLEATGGERGIAAMCIGHGQGIAALVERT